MTEWFEEWFGEEYLRLYPHRDDADAEALVALIRGQVPWRPGLRVLDIGCGPGRHAHALEGAGARVAGLDLSRVLLAHARQAVRGPLVRADMRALPFRPGCADLTVNLFTSFGYFAEDREHAAVLAGMVATLRPEGWFVIDFLHAPSVVAVVQEGRPVPLGDGCVSITKRLVDGGRYVEKTFQLDDGRRFIERVRLFTPQELETMLVAAGLRVRCRFGDYGGGPITPTAPRAILMGDRAR
jgi:SAM-dependent methyltransferase